MNVPELQPDELDVLQAVQDGPDPLIRVAIAAVDTPVRTQDLPHKSAATFTKTVDVNGIVGQQVNQGRLLPGDHRRAVVRLMSIGQNILIGFSNAAYQDASRMALWPANVAFVMNHDGELWVRAAASTTSVSVVVENWATGE